MSQRVVSSHSTTSSTTTGQKPLSRTASAKNVSANNNRRNGGGTDSVENTGILLPTFDDGAGPVALGDLWNCRTNTVEGNLFGEAIGVQYLQADPIQSLDYTLQSCKRTKDVTNIMKISAELSVDFASESTPVSISGKGSYANTESSNFREENIVVTYDALTYQVRVRPTATAIISDQVKALLKKGDNGEPPAIIATHFVQAVLCGGKAQGSIKYSENVSNSDMKITGEFQLSATLGPVTIKGKAEFEKLDKDLSSSYSTTVDVHAQPRFTKSPTTCEEMFKQVEGIDRLIDQERHFPELDKTDKNDPNHVMRVTGVPIKFKLVPIAHILQDFETDELFKLIEEDLLAEFSSMLFNLRDFSGSQYIKRRLAEMQPSIIPILMDDFNPLTIEIRAYATKKAVDAVKLKQEAAKIYIEYKVNNKEPIDLQAMITKYNDEFKPIEVENDLLNFKEAAKKELAAIRASDVNGIVTEDGEPSIKFFSNATDLADWYNTERTIKVLLKTDYTETSPTGVFLKLYDMSPTLAKYGIEVGVAFPNISEGQFSLTYKTQYETTVYTPTEIRFVLEVLGICVDEGETISKIFYSINAALFGLNLPMHEYLFDVPNMVKVMKQYQGTRVCETYCELLAELTESFDTWNIVIPVQALNTGVEMMRFFRQLRVYIPQQFPGLRHKFLVSRFNNVSDKFYSPLLLLFKDNVFQAVCLDHLDILIMMEQFAQPEPDWSLLSFGKMRQSCIYPPRADWAVAVIQNLILDHQTFNTDPVFDLPEFPNNPNLFLPGAIQVARVSAMRDEPEVLTTVALLALADPESAEELEAVLAQNGWKDGHFSPLIWKEIDWSAFYKDIRNFLSNQAPFLMKVVLAMDELNEIPSRPPNDAPPDPEKPPPEWTDDLLNPIIDKIIKFIVDDPATRSHVMTYMWRGTVINEDEVYKKLREQVLSYDGMPAKVRKIGIMKLFEQFIAEESAKPKLFHILSLSNLIEGMQDEQFKSLKHVLLPMTKRYCELVLTDLDDADYPRGRRRLNDSLTERQLFKTVGVLSEMYVSPDLYVLHQEFFNFATLPAPTNVKSVIEKITFLEFDDDQLETIWTNPKFLHALRQVANNESVLDTLFVHVFEWNQRDKKKLQAQVDEEEADLLSYGNVYNTATAEDEDIGEFALGDDQELEFPYWMPPDIVEKVKALIVLRQRPNYDYPKVWDDIQPLIQAFEIIVTRQILPVDFAEVLRQNMEDQADVKQILEAEGVLFYWNETELIFDLPWSLDTVTRVLAILKPKYPEQGEGNVKQIEKPNSCLKLVAHPKAELKAVDPIKVNYMWQPFVRGGALDHLPFQSFLRLDSMNRIARTEYDQLDRSATTMLRYLSQQLKMSNGPSLTAPFFEHYIHYPPFGPRPGIIDFGEGIPPNNLGYFLSRGDLQTALFHLADPTVAHLALCSMAKTPVPLPFLITSIEPMPVPKEGSITPIPSKALLLHPALQDVIVPEMERIVSQPRLFRDPYRFVLTLRVGDTSPDPGRSSFINTHLMKDPTFFSSKLDPGGAYGRPLSRPGFLEFSWLSESTCDATFWENFVKPEYESQRNELILLGLLHGDALSLSSLLEVVRPFVSCFVVFWKVANFNELKAKKKLLSGLLGPGCKVLDVVAYPDPTIVNAVHDQNLLFKQIPGGYQDIVNKAKLQNIFTDGISYTVKTAEELAISQMSAHGDSVLTANTASFLSTIGAFGNSIPKGAKPLSTTAPITVTPLTPVSTPQSIALIEFITATTIGNLQDALANPTPTPEQEALVLELLNTFSSLLSLPQPQREMSLSHFIPELDFLSRMSSLEWVQRLQKVRAQIDQVFSNATEVTPPDSKWVLETQAEFKMTMTKLRRDSMSMQDLWRALWNASNAGNSRNSFLALQNEYLQSGFPLEMFHPSHTETVWGHGVSEVIASLPPTTRIMVISTFGLKSSGKSTLLNALFGLGGFTEAGTTFGLQFRVLWLNEELVAATDCDAFIIIDSEGIGGAENKIDMGADVLERKLVAFLLSISSVSLATVLGPVMHELKEILEVSFASLGKMNELPITPDLYMVQQHLPAQDGAGPAADEFTACLESAIKITTDFELQTGLRVTEAHRLKQVKSRNKHGELVHTVASRGTLVHQDSSPYLLYHSDVKALYEKIIHIAATTRGSRLLLGDWLGSTISLWDNISKIGLPLDQPSALGIRTEVNFEQQVMDVKRDIDAAFFYHEKKAESELNKDLDKYWRDYYDAFDAGLDLRLRKLTGALQKVINTCDDMLEETGAGARRRRKIRMTMAAEPNPNSCIACLQAFKAREALFSQVSKKPRGFLVEEEVNRYISNLRDFIFERIRQGLIARQIVTMQSDRDLHERLEAIREEYPSDVDIQWSKFVQYVSTLVFISPARHRFHAELQEVYKNLGHIATQHKPDGPIDFPDLKPMLAFDVQIYNSALESAMTARKPEKLTWLQHEWLVARLKDIPKQMRDDFESVLYRVGMARELQTRIQKTITLFEEYAGEGLLPNFKWDVHFYAIQLFTEYIQQQQDNWDLKVGKDDDDNEIVLEGSGNPLLALKKMEPHFAEFFKPTTGPPPEPIPRNKSSNQKGSRW